jgi:hypothetical protein
VGQHTEGSEALRPVDETPPHAAHLGTCGSQAAVAGKLCG